MQQATRLAGEPKATVFARRQAFIEVQFVRRHGYEQLHVTDKPLKSEHPQNAAVDFETAVAELRLLANSRDNSAESGWASPCGTCTQEVTFRWQKAGDFHDLIKILRVFGTFSDFTSQMDDQSSSS